MKHFITGLAILLAGCATQSGLKDPVLTKSESELFSEATTKLANQDYSSAIDLLENFESVYPLSKNAPLAQKLLLECYARKKEFPMLKAAVERYVFENPKDPDNGYFEYLKFQALYYEAFGYPYHRAPVKKALRDISKFKDVYFAGAEYLKKFKTSLYSPLVAKKLPYIKEIVADHYFCEGNSLLARNQYYGAMNAYSYVVHNFIDTPQGIKAYERYNQALVELKKNETIISCK